MKRINVDEVDYNKNKHLAQLKVSNLKYVHVFDLDEMEVEMTASSKRLPYDKNYIRNPSTNHWGQRKLIMSELDFLTRYSNDKSVVVYAGAAPGTHIKILARFFPKLKFVLVDPAPFNIESTNKIDIFQQLFDDKFIDYLLSRYESDNILFVSDIRSKGHTACATAGELDRSIMNDMMLQQSWVDKIKPKYSLLKFRLPFDKQVARYLRGTILFPIFGPVHTSESRLLVDAKDNFMKRPYSNEEYEEKMFEFICHTRVQFYKHDVTNVVGMDHCYDCASEVRILKEYLQHNKSTVGVTIKELSDYITKNIAYDKDKMRTLATIVTKSSRKKWYSDKLLDCEQGGYRDVNFENIHGQYIKKMLGEFSHMTN